jgi:hypothetical protein
VLPDTVLDDDFARRLDAHLALMNTR